VKHLFNRIIVWRSLAICVLQLVCSCLVHLVKVAVSLDWRVLILVLIVHVMSCSMSFMICSWTCLASRAGVGAAGFGGDLVALEDTVPSLLHLFGLLLVRAGYSFGSKVKSCGV